MNRRDLALCIAALAAAGVPARAAAQARRADPDADIAFYNTFNAQLAATPAEFRDDVRRLYELNGWRPLWTPARFQALAAAIAQADRHGLDPRDFLDPVEVLSDPRRADMRLSLAALGYGRVLSQGRVRPEAVENLWELQRNAQDLPPGLVDAVYSDSLAGWLDQLAPNDIGYRGLSTGYIRYRDIARDGGWPAFRPGAVIRPGDDDARVPALRARLIAEGDLDAVDAGPAGAGPASGWSRPTRYDEALQAGVRRFQTRHGLDPDAVVGAGTQAALSASAEDRARQIALNLERRRWLNRALAPERIEVNTAAAIMVYWRDGKPVHANRVVCGTPRNPTPSLEKPFASVVANPPWNVPASITRNEILPRLASDPGYLARNGMYMVDGRVVQRASPNAALGLVKFELRDSYAIFLHDTPSKAAFNNAYRHRSHGCVRVENAVEFARLLLSPDPVALAAFDTAQANGKTTRVETGREIAVRLLYWTAFVDGQGRVAFREDVYKRDARLADALGIAISLPEPADDGETNPNDVGP